MNTVVIANDPDDPIDYYRKMQAIADCQAALSNLVTEIIFGIESRELEVSDVTDALEEFRYCVIHLESLFEPGCKEAA